MNEEIKKHIKNGLEIVSQEIDLYETNPDYHNDHFLKEIFARFRQLNREIIEN